MATKDFDLESDGGLDSAPDIDFDTSSPKPELDKGVITAEESDPNDINVVISDPSPVIILFGARSSGKTMTLVRLARWLIKNGFKVEPDRNFRPADSLRYREACDNFFQLVNSDKAADRTHILNFMLVKVMNKYGEPICQILEAPGEHYFDDAYPNKPFPAYINRICTIDNPKTWMFIVEKEWKDAQDRNHYANKIIRMQGQIEPRDRVIFTCHKSDLHPALFNAGSPNRPQFFKNISNQYPGIFSRYLNNNPITRLWRKYNFDFVVFSSGLFSETSGGGQTYTQSNDRYPAELWRSIMKTVRGGW